MRSTRRWRQRRGVLLALVGLLAVAVGITTRATHVTRALDEKSIDARFTIRGRTPPPEGITLVAVDAATFNYFRSANMPSQWPFPRRYYARALDNLHRAGARVIGLDIQFTEPTDAADDNALYDSVSRNRPVVLSTTEVQGHGQTAVLGGNQNLAAAGARPGNSNFAPDRDGVIRRMAYSIQGLNTFSVVLGEALSGRSVPRSSFGDGTVPIYFSYPSGTLPTLSLSDVYRGGFDPAAVRGRLVIIGATAPSLQDIHATPTSATMSGPELQANAAATVLRQLPLKDAAGTVDVLLIVIMGLIQPLAASRLPSLRGMLVGFGFAIIFAGAAQLAFNAGVIVGFADPIVALLVAIIGSLAVLFLSETVEREVTRSLFSRFVPAAVVDQVLSRAGDNLRLGAVERDCTVMFSDLRGFTSFSEKQPPQHVIEVVNFYLEEMTQAILCAGGTLISYMGDGIMALFGAPLEQPDHADRALEAAREMVGERLDRFNAWIVEQGHPAGFRMGVGLHSGLVMAGNVGSEDRLDYTAIGDTTNTASRLEGLTKNTDYMLLISTATRQRLQREPEDLVFVDELGIRGRAEKIEVWSVEASRAVVNPQSPASV